jgi:hypothetical protein
MEAKLFYRHKMDVTIGYKLNQIGINNGIRKEYSKQESSPRCIGVN